MRQNSIDIHPILVYNTNSWDVNSFPWSLVECPEVPFLASTLVNIFSVPDRGNINQSWSVLLSPLGSMSGLSSGRPQVRRWQVAFLVFLCRMMNSSGFTKEWTKAMCRVTCERNYHYFSFPTSYCLELNLVLVVNCCSDSVNSKVISRFKV